MSRVRLLCAVLVSFALLVVPLATAGCGDSGQPTLMSFTGKGSDSAKSMKEIVNNLKKKYKGEVIFIDVDMDDAESKAEIEKYHVTMNPTFIVLNTEGQVKETFMGAAQEEMLVSAIESYIPKKSTTTGTAPTTPSSYPSSTSPSSTGSTPQTVP